MAVTGEEAFRARHGGRLSRIEGERRRRDYSEESGGSTLGAPIQTMKEALLHLHLLTAHTDANGETLPSSGQ